MTNLIKAPRPCTLWGKTFDSNGYLGYDIINNSEFYGIGVHDNFGRIVAQSPNLIDVEDKTERQLRFSDFLREFCLAIASAQRQWLKAEGFEFDTYAKKKVNTVYRLLHKSGHEFTGFRQVLTAEQCGKDFDYFRLSLPNGESLPKADYGGFGNGSLSHGTYLCEFYDVSEIVAFKPLSDSQEAWGTVAHVEVWSS